MEKSSEVFVSLADRLARAGQFICTQLNLFDVEVENTGAAPCLDRFEYDDMGRYYEETQ